MPGVVDVARALNRARPGSIVAVTVLVVARPPHWERPLRLRTERVGIANQPRARQRRERVGRRSCASGAVAARAWPFDSRQCSAVVLRTADDGVASPETNRQWLAWGMG